MSGRVRSPNYPAVGLKEAIERTRRIFAEIDKNAQDREIIARAMGYNGLNGASATVLSALVKFGLIEPAGDSKYRVSEMGKSILHPGSAEEKARGIQQAAKRPDLYADIFSEFGGRVPSNEILGSVLIKRGFSQKAVPEVIEGLRETFELLEQHSIAEPSASQGTEEERPAQKSDPEREEFEPEGTETFVFRVSPTSVAKVYFTGEVTQQAVQKLIRYMEIAKDDFPSVE